MYKKTQLKQFSSLAQAANSMPKTLFKVFAILTRVGRKNKGRYGLASSATMLNLECLE